MYETEMLPAFGQLSNEAVQTIIYRTGEMLWKQEYSLSYLMTEVVTILPLRANFRQALHLPIDMQFRR